MPAALATTGDAADAGTTSTAPAVTPSYSPEPFTGYAEPGDEVEVAIDYGHGKIDEETGRGDPELMIAVRAEVPTGGTAPSVKGLVFTVTDTDPLVDEDPQTCTTDDAGMCVVHHTYWSFDGGPHEEPFDGGPSVVLGHSYTITQAAAASDPTLNAKSTTVTMVDEVGAAGMVFTIPAPATTPAPVTTETSPPTVTSAPVAAPAAPITSASTGSASGPSAARGSRSGTATSSAAASSTAPAVVPTPASPPAATTSATTSAAAAARPTVLAAPDLQPVADTGVSGIAGQPAVVVGLGAAVLAFAFFFLALRRRRRTQE
jgi:hypothetical protein